MNTTEYKQMQTKNANELQLDSEKDNFGKRLHWLMMRKKINQALLAEETGFDKSSISQWITGKRKAGEKNCIRLADYFSCNPLWLLHGKGHPFTENNSINQSHIENANAVQGSTVDTISINAAEDHSELVRMYRKLEPLSKHIIMEIVDWLEDMEKIRPGFKAWFTVEFQNRFPELDDWKRDRKKNKNENL